MKNIIKNQQIIADKINELEKKSLPGPFIPEKRKILITTGSTFIIQSHFLRITLKTMLKDIFLTQEVKK